MSTLRNWWSSGTQTRAPSSPTLATWSSKAPSNVDGGALDWLRATLSRFCNGDVHDRRRALVETELERIDPAFLERDAYERTLATLRTSRGASGQHDRVAEVARAVPVAALAACLGTPEDRLDAVVEAVSAAAPAYLAGSKMDAELRRRADHGVEQLLRLLGPAAPEDLACRAGLLLQACDATAALAVSAFEKAQLMYSCLGLWPVSAVVSETLRYDLPGPSARWWRVEDGGGLAPVRVDVAAANRDPDVFPEPDRFDPGRNGRRHLSFGFGVRPCPGAAHAVALACGVVAALLACATEPAAQGSSDGS